MEKNKIRVRTAVALSVVVMFIVFVYVANKNFIDRDMFVSMSDITGGNIRRKFFQNSLTMLLLPLILIIINIRRLEEFELRFRGSYLQYILIGIMVVLFFLNGDYSVRGFYKFFFYLVFIGFGEEFIFRGYVYNELRSNNRLFAIIISGLAWGIMHAILPGLLSGTSIMGIGADMLGHIGVGILAGYYFIYIMEKSGSLFIPVFVHAILDYTVGPIGFITAAGVGIYLDAMDREKVKFEEEVL